MPRIKTGIEDRPRPVSVALSDQLAQELRNGRESGQPIIYEQQFPTGSLRITVVWDAWEDYSLDQRTDIILRAYEKAEGTAYRDRIALASGLTAPEAHAAGMLPVQIIPALRREDKVTIDDCRKAMIEEGASTLFGNDRLQLRFATTDEAEAARLRLAKRLPESEQVWLITQDVAAFSDAAMSEDHGN
jgi:hypothetical protein